jgi:DNA-binding NtrC family response regulator
VNLLEAIGRKNFREDLFYRLNVVHIRMPPLRERAADLHEIATGFVKSYARKHGRKASSIDPTAMRLLEQYDFPGNVRELANTIERAVIVSEERSLSEGHLPDSLRAAVKVLRRANQRGTLAEMEAAYVNEILAATKGNKSEAARILGISRKNLYERISRTK